MIPMPLALVNDKSCNYWRCLLPCSPIASINGGRLAYMFAAGQNSALAATAVAGCLGGFMHNTDLALAMRQGMRRLASGVCILSTRVNHQERFAMTVSSVTSVSDDPPSLLVCINRQISLKGHLEVLGCPFAVSILSTEQQRASNVCAGFEPVHDRFSVGRWQEGPDAIPYLQDSEAIFFCKTDQVTTYGTHHILVGRIEDVLVSEHKASPLLYHDGGYNHLASHEQRPKNQSE